MSENEERAKGKLQEIGGSVKETVGRVVGNERIEDEGRGDKLEGQDRQEVAKGVGRVKGAAEEVAGNIKQGLGDLTGSERLRDEGEADELKGKARQDLNS